MAIGLSGMQSAGCLGPQMMANTVAPPPSPVESALNSLGGAVDNLSRELQMLVSRLSPVSSEMPTSGSGKDQGTPTALCEVEGRIRIYTNGIADLTAMVEAARAALRI